MVMKKIYIVGWLLMLGVLAACSAPVGAPSPLPVQELSLKVDNTLSFAPNVLQVTAGQSAHLTLQNGGDLEHDFNVDNLALSQAPVASGGAHHHHSPAATPEVGKFNLHVAATAEEMGILDFTPTEPGEYEFYCSIPGHKEAGMVGKLIVVEESDD